MSRKSVAFYPFGKMPRWSGVLATFVFISFAFQSCSPQVNNWIAPSTLYLGEIELAGIIREAPESRFHKVVRDAIQGASLESTKDCINRLLRDPKADLRGRASAAIRHLPTQLATRYSQITLRDREVSVRAFTYESLGFVSCRESAAILIAGLEEDTEALDVIVAALSRLIFPPFEFEGPDERLVVDYLVVPEKKRYATIENWKQWWMNTAKLDWSKVVIPYARDSNSIYEDP